MGIINVEEEPEEMAVRRRDEKQEASSEELPAEQEVFQEAEPEFVRERSEAPTQTSSQTSSQTISQPERSDKMRFFNASSQNIEIEIGRNEIVRIGSRQLSDKVDRSLLTHPTVKFYMSANELLVRE